MWGDLLWLGNVLLLYALLCASGLAVVVLCHRLASWWHGRHPPTPAPPPRDDWRQAHVLWQARPPSLIDDPHGPARCRCAHCQARRAATR